MDKSLSKLDSETTDDFIERLISLEQKDIDYDNNIALLKYAESERLYKAIPKFIPTSKSGKRRKKAKWEAYFHSLGYRL